MRTRQFLPSDFVVQAACAERAIRRNGPDPFAARLAAPGKEHGPFIRSRYIIFHVHALLSPRSGDNLDAPATTSVSGTVCVVAVAGALTDLTPATPTGRGATAGFDPPAQQQLIADGWRYASINPGSIQADNSEGLTKGIIGFVNKGQRRKPDDWGALRAWAWGASCGLRKASPDNRASFPGDKALF